ncbi:MAG: hypothetical protein MZW92_67865 [Comamonadaceae bacterium]|nr:hypothetical protein [Comamonadaceae bacterium]
MRWVFDEGPADPGCPRRSGGDHGLLDRYHGAQAHGAGAAGKRAALRPVR